MKDGQKLLSKISKTSPSLSCSLIPVNTETLPANALLSVVNLTKLQIALSYAAMLLIMVAIYEYIVWGSWFISDNQ